MKALLTKTQAGNYIPATSKDYEILSSVKVGEFLTCSVDDSRNILHHRKYFALLNLTVHHLPEKLSKRICNTDLLLIELKLRLGHYQLYVSRKGERMYIPKSINFQKMGQKKFEEFYSRSVDLILSEYLIGWSDELIENEILNFI